MTEYLALVWFLLAVPKLMPNIKRAWRESRNMKAGPLLSILYLGSAIVSGLTFKDDLKAA